MAGAATMARSKAQAKQDKALPASSDARVTIINLKGTEDQAAWLDTVHKATHIPKSVIVRLALKAWATKNGHPEFPESEAVD